MDIIIRDTNERESLSIIDPKSGVNFIGDFIGNSGAFDNGDFTATETGEFVCDRETFAWWRDVVSDYQALEYRIANLISEHGYGAVCDALSRAECADLEYQCAFINQALDDDFGTNLDHAKAWTQI